MRTATWTFIAHALSARLRVPCDGPLQTTGAVECQAVASRAKQAREVRDKEHTGRVGRGFDFVKNGLALDQEVGHGKTKAEKRLVGGNPSRMPSDFRPPLRVPPSKHFNSIAKQNGLKLPWWMVQTLKVLDEVQKFLSQVKIQLPTPDIRDAPRLADMKVALFDTVQDTKALVFNGGRELISLIKVLIGGKGANAALQTMLDVANRPMGLFMLKMTGAEFVCSLLASRESTPDETRHLALSVLARIRNVPATSIVADMGSGSFTHGNIVLPRPSRVFRGDKLWSLLNMGDTPQVFEEGWSISEEVPNLNEAAEQVYLTEEVALRDS